MVLLLRSSPLVAFAAIIVLCVVGFYSLHFPLRHYSKTATETDATSRFHHVFLSSSSNATVANYLRTLTAHPHLAGTKPAASTARYVLNHFANLGLETRTAEHPALLSYPVRSSLAAHFSNGTSHKFRLAEPGLEEADEVVRPYHAYSPSGAAEAAAVYVNYGREEDYRLLSAAGVDVSGCVAVARGGRLPRGAVVEVAERRGAVAAVVFGEWDTWREGSERGHVMRGGIGDPLSPGWGGVEGGESLGLDDSKVFEKFPKILSMPLSAEAAERILESLGGAPLPLDWKGTVNLKVRNVGPGPTILNFTYQGELKVATIENVFAIIKGREECDRHVLLGNHRDAWTYGAVDPNSGTAALLDIARRFSILSRSGWTPRRTIILCSWDAEEFGVIGSTEWVEQNLVNLRSKAVAYLNVDCAVQGPGLFAGSTPQLDDLLLEVIKQIKDPDSDEGTTIYENWEAAGGNPNIQRLGSVNSDFAPFVQHAGVPSIDVYYGKDYPVYHTAFDSYNWMIKSGDPFFQRHIAVAGVWGLLALRLADDSIIPFNYLPYADQLQVYNNKLSNFLLDKRISLHPLNTSIQEFASAAKEANDESKKLRLQETSNRSIDMKMRALNDRLMLAEKGFLDTDGLPGRKWFKHLVYGPPDDHESKIDFFPGIADSMSEMVEMSEKERLAAIQHEIWRVARAIQRAASALRGDLA